MLCGFLQATAGPKIIPFHLVVSQYFSGEDEITFLNENNNISTSLVLVQGNCSIVSAFYRMNSSLFFSRS